MYSECVCVLHAEIAAAWLSTLLDVIDLLPKDIISREVGPTLHCMCNCIYSSSIYFFDLFCGHYIGSQSPTAPNSYTAC